MPKRKPESVPSRPEPGPGRSTSESAFNDLRKEIDQRNERVHQQARQLRNVREREQVLRRRELDEL